MPKCRQKHGHFLKYFTRLIFASDEWRFDLDVFIGWFWRFFLFPHRIIFYNSRKWNTRHFDVCFLKWIFHFLQNMYEVRTGLIVFECYVTAGNISRILSNRGAKLTVPSFSISPVLVFKYSVRVAIVSWCFLDNALFSHFLSWELTNHLDTLRSLPQPVCVHKQRSF